MTSFYTRPDGTQGLRADGGDLGCLQERVAAPLIASGLTPGSDWGARLADGMSAYKRGAADVALAQMKACIAQYPALENELFFHIRCCERILAQYAEDVRQYKARPAISRMLSSAPSLAPRCKWCGKDTPYVDPNVQTFGFSVLANGCSKCFRMYPMPDLIWDSPEGRAYSYFRKSFKGPEFYAEFEADYEVAK